MGIWLKGRILVCFPSVNCSLLANEFTIAGDIQYTFAAGLGRNDRSGYALPLQRRDIFHMQRILAASAIFKIVMQGAPHGAECEFFPRNFRFCKQSHFQ